MTLAEKHRIAEILDRCRVCACGTTDTWKCVFDLLCEAENHTQDGFYRDQWFEWGAKVLDKWGLLEHGGGIGGAWLTEDGKLLLQFLRTYGLEDAGHPEWAF